MAKSKIIKANKKIEQHMISGYKKIENGVVGVLWEVRYRWRAQSAREAHLRFG